ncbi:MAG: 2-succinyl-5-enolpyruvyl-6-hydroxy-3-cyclohexene-1-carboxylate synthase [Bacteroidales bacterium]|nr:2-succinyl-5-enolpyruvyl-6-hydroxy-3-cyclohexene-1-carboxylate synthase [Bacteroidales bacterium]
MNTYYTVERNIQIVLSLMKAHGIKRVIASPGATDVSLVASMQHDSYFEMYSCVDERSAAYMACGMAAESGEPVVITCTGATSSRNYMPGLTEAYYRKLPVLAITCCRSNVNVGHYVDQVTDRSALPNDIVNISVYAQSINCPEDEWDVMIKVNKAILGLKYNGGGPCHINLATTYEKDFSVREIAPVRVVHRYELGDRLPEIPDGKIGIFVGAHTKWDKELLQTVDRFCGIYNAAVFCDHTSNYKGQYRVLFPLIEEQNDAKFNDPEVDLLIHIGYVSNCVFKGKQIWRVNPDGEIRDTFRKMQNVFQMTELDFFSYYVKGKSGNQSQYAKMWQERYESFLSKIPELPFSNLWIAKTISKKIPDNAVIHLGIRNSIRSWNYFEIPESVLGYCNTGGFGIDGGVSSLIGASLLNPDNLYFGIFGDLLFFYDMNSIGNREIMSNVRILIVNNGLGQEFKNYSCFSSMFGEDTNSYIAAQGHFGNQSRQLVKNYAEALGFDYLTASNKEEFNSVYPSFVCPIIGEKPVIFEVFTDSNDECKALELTTIVGMKSKIIKVAGEIVSRPELKSVKQVLKKIVK